MKLFIVLGAVFACALSAPHFEPRITGGSDATEGEFPYQVSVQYTNYDLFIHICGGTILSPEWILTAGHCITELPREGKMAVVAGVAYLKDFEDNRQNALVIQRIVHPEYEGIIGTHDIALLKLDRPLEFTAFVQPATLPKAGVAPTGNAVISGWGSISKTAVDDYPQQLQKSDVTIINLEECKAAFQALPIQDQPTLEESHVCTGPLNNGVSVCSGDSGGPLAQNGEVVGVVSFAVKPCGIVAAPSVYTRVSSYISFIESYIH